MSTFDEDLLLRAPKIQQHRQEQTGAPQHDAGPTGASGPGGTHSQAAVLQLQRAAGNAAVTQRMRGEEDLESVNRARSGGGQPLDAGTKSHMERSIGADFSDVRVHTGSEADSSAKSLGAHAYTVGSDVVFAQGRFDPASDNGQRTLAHELTHVVQQRSGPVEGTATGGGVQVSDPSDSFERAAEASADQVMAARQVDTAAPDVAAPAAAALQRHESEDSDVQRLAVQREGEEEEEVQTLAVQREGEEQEEEMAG